MIRCNKCMRLFKDASELVQILETQTDTGDYVRVIYDMQYIDENSSVFSVCPECMIDEHLVDLDTDVETI